MIAAGRPRGCRVVRRADSFPFKGKAGMGMVWLLWLNHDTIPTSILSLKGRRYEHRRSMGCRVVGRADSFPFKGKAGMGMVWLNRNTIPTSILPLKGRR
jgi:hypothetical protein